MDEIKYPLIFVLDIKRGVKWSERRVELHKERIKYFNPSKIIIILEDNELRFESKLSDCLLVNEEPRKYKLLSKTK
jgi:hypothetical protein